jgi:Flp pilus assembly protein TadD
MSASANPKTGAGARRPLALALVLACAALSGCKTMGMGDFTASIAPQNEALPSSDAALRQYADVWGKRFEADPKSKANALNYARALRALTRYQEAVAVLREAAVMRPQDEEVLGAYGKALADDGRLQEAAEVLSRAHSPERPNWSILNAQGSVADQLGDHAHAQAYYAAALKIVPDEPTVLSNLGLSYAMSKQLGEAEETLRRASNQPKADFRVRQNLALVLALQGKFQEAEAISRQDLSPQDAAANIASIRAMIARSSNWRDIQTQHKPSRQS